MHIDVMIFEQYYFYFNGEQYGNGTIVKIHQDKRDRFDYYTNIIFKGYNYNDDNLYHFGSLYDKWKDYCITQDELYLYIEKIEKACSSLPLQNAFEKIHPSNIEGIVAAWMWYIFIMIFAVFINGIISTIITWVIASYIFWKWRNKKINGG